MGYRHIFQFPRGNKIYGFINVSDGRNAGIHDSAYSHTYQNDYLKKIKRIKMLK